MQVNFHHLSLIDTTVIFKTSGLFIMVISHVNLWVQCSTAYLDAWDCVMLKDVYSSPAPSYILGYLAESFA